MQKQRLNLCVDMDVYILAKQQDVNLSEYVNVLLKTGLNVRKDHIDEEKEQMIEELKLLQQQKEDLTKKIIELEVKINTIDQRQAKESKEKLKKLEKMAQSLKRDPRQYI